MLWLNEKEPNFFREKQFDSLVLFHSIRTKQSDQLSSHHQLKLLDKELSLNVLTSKMWGLNIIQGSRAYAKEHLKTGIHEIEIPSSVELIYYKAFSGCYNLKNIWFAEKSRLKAVGGKSIVIPSSCLYIVKSFILKSISFQENSQLKVIGICAFYEQSIESVIFPAGLVKILSQAFKDSNLKSITFPTDSRLKVIERQAYWFTKIASIHFPTSIEYIGDIAFNSCFNLKAQSLTKKLTNMLFIQQESSLLFYLQELKRYSIVLFLNA